MRPLNAFFDNDSAFGQIMTRLGILIASNLLFIACSVPVVTIGASFAALHYVMLRLLRGENELNPFRVFWQGLKENFVQATICWVGVLALAAVLYLELFWCRQFEGPVALFQYPLMALMLILLVLASYMFPTMAAFHVTMSQLIADCIYFAVRRPVTILIVLLTDIVPMALTYLDYPRLPLYAFLWCMFGFGLLAFSNSRQLLKLYLPYLEKKEEFANEDEGAEKRPSEKQILDDMKKLEM